MKQMFKTLLCWCKVMLISITGYGQANITTAEYFFDSDPGFGNGTVVALTPAANVNSLLFNANVAPLSNGMHTLFVRTKDANGKWSITKSTNIAKFQAPGGNPNTTSNIAQAEYFYDADPGYGNGTQITLPSASNNITSLVFNADVSTLATGVHTLYLRTRDAAGWSVTQNYYFVKIQSPGGNPSSATNIVKAEYFYDNEPGFGNGTNIPFSAAANVAGLSFNADVTSLANGVHTLYIRTQDAQGKWSITSAMLFAKFQALGSNPHTVSNITKAEYFFNTDPGLGNGTDIPVTAATNINGFLVNVDVSSLFTGLHTLYIRTRDAQGKWSITHWHQFSRIQGLSANPHSLSKINKAEYFFDNDPGFGNGTNIPIATPATNISALTFNADVSSLTNGMHTIYTRTRDSAGQWSVTTNFYFVKFQPLATNPHVLSNIVKAEYFYDHDPGYGNGTNIPVTAAMNITGLAFNANVTALANGVHTVYVRTKDANGAWSITQSAVFAKVQSLSGNPHSKSNIARIEYFVDTDPGIGNGIPVGFTADTNVTNVVFNVDMTVLVNSQHKLYVRTKDLSGKWSITNILEFTGGTAPLSIQLISFEAKLLEDKSVRLEWVTEQENNVDRYLIERSHDATNWSYVGEQKPNGQSSNERKVYQMLDKEPGTGIVYYRLTEIDLNNHATTAPIRFVRISENGQDVASLFPNPNDGRQLHISSSLFIDQEVTITILSTDGKVHLKQTIPAGNASILTLSDLNLAAGNYFVQLHGTNKTESLKLQVTANRL